MTHDELCRRAVTVLRRMSCDPVFSLGASCREVPDAIGWNSSGSIVIECKTSLSDFLADKAKYRGWKHPEYKWTKAGIRSASRPKESMLKAGYESCALPSMGLRRFFMCDSDLITADMIAKHYPDHGLLQVFGRGVRIAVDAPEREDADFRSETRYLRMRLLHVRQGMKAAGFAVDFNRATLFAGEFAVTLPTGENHGITKSGI